MRPLSYSFGLPLFHGQSGVYKITTPDGRAYGGCSADLGVRWAGHLSAVRGGRHPVKALQAFYNEQGILDWSFEVVELCAPSELLEKEREAIIVLKPAYNRCLLATSGTTRDLRRRLSDGAKKHADSNGRVPASGYKGVSPTESGKWRAVITYRGVSHHIGTYGDPATASEDYRLLSHVFFGGDLAG